MRHNNSFQPTPRPSASGRLKSTVTRTLRSNPSAVLGKGITALIPHRTVSSDPATHEMIRKMEGQFERHEAKAEYWDERRRAQLGFLNNLLFGLALAALVLLQDALLNPDVRASATGLSFILGGLGLIGLSFVSGLAVSLLRLHDYRTEAKLSRDRANLDSKARSTRSRP